MLWPSMEPFCAIAEMLQHPKTAESKRRWKRAKDLISVMCGRIAENAPAVRSYPLLIFFLEGVEIVVFAYILVFFCDLYTGGSKQPPILLGP
jgi:hypothetical protein